MPTTKTKLKLRKMNTFINRDREIEPMTETDKYILETIERIKNENFSAITRGSLRPQHT
jgi:hypothetical protein